LRFVRRCACRDNQGLSLRRCRTVAAELVRDGVPQNAISIQGLGDTKLLVPTGHGVREPQKQARGNHHPLTASVTGMSVVCQTADNRLLSASRIAEGTRHHI
jgi:hypothetical protein